MNLLLRWVITAAALFAAVWLVPGIEVGENAWTALFVTAAVLGLLNALLRPILKFLSCGLIVVTLGLFTFVINAAMLWLASWISVTWLDAAFVVDDFISALIGSIIVSVVSFVLSLILLDDDDDKKKRKRR
jgi:putative membrane protein